MDDLLFASALQIAKAIQQKEVSCVEVMDAHLRRIAAVNPLINAVVYLDEQQARSEAQAADAALARGDLKGLLHGVPVTVKDNIGVEGMVCSSGTPGLAQNIPQHDAVMVARLRRAGAVILGMTNMPELGVAFESDNLVYGRSNNPYDLSRTPGGSSGGESAIISAGGSALGLGNDGAGSVRTPAAFCGIVGLKPTQGRIPVTGHVTTSYSGFYPGVSQDGPLARFAEDINTVLPIIAGPDGSDPNITPMPVLDMHAVDLKTLRVAYYTDDGFATPTPSVVSAVQDAVRALKDAGLTVEENRPDVLDQAYDIRIGFYGAVSASGFEDGLRRMGTPEISPLARRFLEMTADYHHISKAELLELTTRLGNFRHRMLRFMQNYDVIVCPVYASPAVPHGETDFRHASYTIAYNLTGWPGAAVRAGTDPSGLPVGVQVVARPWREDHTLAVAHCIEKALGGYQRPPI